MEQKTYVWNGNAIYRWLKILWYRKQTNPQFITLCLDSIKSWSVESRQVKVTIYLDKTLVRFHTMPLSSVNGQEILLTSVTYQHSLLKMMRNKSRKLAVV